MINLAIRGILAFLSFQLMLAHAEIGSEAERPSTARPSGMSCEHLLVGSSNLLESPPEVRIHFQSQFEMIPKFSGTDLLDVAVSQIAEWLLRSPALRGLNAAPMTALVNSEEFHGNTEFNSADNSVHVITRASSFSKNQTQVWALLFQHPDSQYPQARLWRTQVALTRASDGSLKVSLRVSYFPNPTMLVAQEPPEPAFFAPPRLFTVLASGSAWTLHSGIMPISGEASKVLPHELGSLQHVVQDEQRELPIVLFVRPPEYSNVSDYSNYLAKLMVGQALVLYEGAATDDQDTLATRARRLSPADASLVPASGGIVIFMPRTRWAATELSHGIFQIPFNAELFQNPDFANRIRTHVNRLSLTSHLANPNASLSTIWDLDRANLVAHLEDIRQALAQDRSHPPAVQAGQQEAFYRELVRLYEAEIAEVTTKLGRAELQHAETHQIVEALRAEVEDLKKRAYVKTETVHLDALAKDWTGIKWDEFDPNERYVQMVESYFPRTIVFSDQVLKSVKKMRFDEPEVLFHILLKLAADLNQLVFVEKNPSYVNEFKLRTKFDISNETSTTRANSVIQRERTVNVDGKTYVGWLHVKYGVREPNMVRVYFDFDQDKQRIVVTHIASHLRVSSSGKNGGAK